MQECVKETVEQVLDDDAVKEIIKTIVNA